MVRITSERHTDILNGYKNGGSRYNEWAEKALGLILLEKWEWGALTFRWEIDERFVMPDGVVFGGHIASVADHIASLAAMSVLTDNRERFRTSQLEVNYFRPLMRPRALIEARVTNASKTLIHIEADLYNADDKLAARIYATEVRRMTG
ncbi:MAG: PaaI family thioesterase [Pseudomonadota bacterium]